MSTFTLPVLGGSTGVVGVGVVAEGPVGDESLHVTPSSATLQINSSRQQRE
jgi:hypothetical protein